MRYQGTETQLESPIRRPEGEVLYRVLAEHLENFLLQVDLDETRSSLPAFVRRELSDYLSCGILAKGFARVHCSTCKQDGLVAFSCKRRGICPSCGARRMVDLAAHWVDHVIPDVPVRQWVLSLPHRIRYRLGYDPKLLAGVRWVFMYAVQSWVKRRMRDLGAADGRTGGVVCVQRFDSALRLDPHLHALVLDGVYTGLERDGEVVFHPLPMPSDEDIEKLVKSLHGRVLSLLRRRGVLEESRTSARNKPRPFDLPAYRGRADASPTTALRGRQSCWQGNGRCESACFAARNGMELL